MFVRRKQNKSGSISIQVVAKVSGKYRVQKSFGSIGQNQLRLAGPDLIYGRLFDKIGFGAVRTSDDEIF